MKYVIVFEYEPDPEAEPEFKDGMNVYRISGLDRNYDVKGTIRKLPSRRPSSDYKYNTYQEGYDKGVNDTLDHLEGINGEYDPEKDKRNNPNV